MAQVRAFPSVTFQSGVRSSVDSRLIQIFSGTPHGSLGVVNTLFLSIPRICIIIVFVHDFNV